MRAYTPHDYIYVYKYICVCLCVQMFYKHYTGELVI